tara:strand:+ start:273 stop:467 length:195 start_codon:yes stop_codon:yes gene_type:complete
MRSTVVLCSVRSDDDRSVERVREADSDEIVTDSSFAWSAWRALRIAGEVVCVGIGVGVEVEWEE